MQINQSTAYKASSSLSGSHSSSYYPPSLITQGLGPKHRDSLCAGPNEMIQTSSILNQLFLLHWSLPPENTVKTLSTFPRCFLCLLTYPGASPCGWPLHGVHASCFEGTISKLYSWQSFLYLCVLTTLG